MIYLSLKNLIIQRLVNNNLDLIKQIGRVNTINDNKKKGNKTIEILVLKEKLSLMFNEDVDLNLKKREFLKR